MVLLLLFTGSASVLGVIHIRKLIEGAKRESTTADARGGTEAAPDPILRIGEEPSTLSTPSAISLPSDTSLAGREAHGILEEHSIL